MSRKILCLLLLAVMMLPMFASCTPMSTPTVEGTMENGTSTQTPEASATPTPTPTPTPEPTPLPSASSLLGTKHVPPIDSQGSIGSCSSQSVTYTQFTIAVSQYMNNVLNKTNWDPSSGNKAYIFSPKSTFVYSGAGTQFQYDILTDSGALPLTMSTFKKSGDASVNDDPLSRAWDCAKGYMAEALKYRLSGYEEVEFDSFSYDFKTTLGQLHMERVKRAICDGNAVSVCGWSSYWQYTKVMEPGSLAKPGDGVIWAGWKNVEGDSGDGNHAVTIVGYDDDITVTIAGVKMKGAFLIANSWGIGYQNDGYVWMMYDSFNKESEYAALAEKGFYSSRPAFFSSESDVAKVKMSYASRENTQLLYTKTTEMATVEGKEYPIYTIKDTVYNKYLSSDSTGKMVWSAVSDDGSAWVLIPYADYSTWEGFTFGADATYNDVSYKDTFLICSVEKYKNIKSACFVQIAEASGSTSGREVILEAVTGKTVNKFAAIVNSYTEKKDTFECSLRANTVSNLHEFERTGTLYRTSFVRWDKDVLIDSPNLIVEVEVEAVKRESFSIKLFRTDASGNTIEKTPTIINNNLQNTTAMKSPTGETRFDGNDADGTFCKGYIAFGFNEYALLSEHYEFSNLLWGVTIKGNNLGVKVRSLRLMTLDGTVLSEVKVNEEYCEIGKGESRSFYFDLGGEKKDYAASPGTNTYLFNVGAQLHLNKRKSNYYTLGTEKDKEARFTFELREDGTYYLWYDSKWLLDVKGDEIVDGAVVRKNVFRDERTTNAWKIEMIEGNAFIIRLADDPRFMVIYDAEKDDLVITSKEDPKGYHKWQAFSDVVNLPEIKVESVDNKLEISGLVPEEGYTAGNIDIKVTNSDGTYNDLTISVTPKDGAFSAKVDALPAGTYIFTAIYEGKPYGFQYIYTVK